MMFENFRYVTEALLLSRGCLPDRVDRVMQELEEEGPIPGSVSEVLAAVDAAIKKVGLTFP